MAKIQLQIINPERYFEGIINVIKKEYKTKNIIYVTTNRPFNLIKNSLLGKGINTDKILFVDCISKYIKEKKKTENDNCILIGSPQNLTAISIAVDEATKIIKGKKILLLDSLSVLLIYNDANTISKFSNFLMNKMRASDVDTIVMALESDSDKDVIKQIESFADVVKRGVK